MLYGHDAAAERRGHVAVCGRAPQRRRGRAVSPGPPSPATVNVRTQEAIQEGRVLLASKHAQAALYPACLFVKRPSPSRHAHAALSLCRHPRPLALQALVAQLLGPPLPDPEAALPRVALTAAVCVYVSAAARLADALTDALLAQVTSASGGRASSGACRAAGAIRAPGARDQRRPAAGAWPAALGS